MLAYIPYSALTITSPLRQPKGTGSQDHYILIIIIIVLEWKKCVINFFYNYYYFITKFTLKFLLKFLLVDKWFLKALINLKHLFCMRAAVCLKQDFFLKTLYAKVIAWQWLK